MLAGAVVAFKRWREKRREYQLQRALYKMGGGADAPDQQSMRAEWGPTTVTHMPDLSKLAEDEDRP